jgi:hypothetical protein
MGRRRVSFKVAPGVRISASSKGVRTSIGSNKARVPLGGGRTSTAAKVAGSHDGCHRVAGAALGAVLAIGLAGCAGSHEPDPAEVDRAEPTATRTPRFPRETQAPTEDVAFEPCPRTPAEPDRSNLHPRTPAPADATADVDRFGQIPVDGPMVAEDIGDLS